MISRQSKSRNLPTSTHGAIIKFGATEGDGRPSRFDRNTYLAIVRRYLA